MLCCVRRSIRVVYAAPIMGNMTSSIKPELHIVSQRLQSRHRSTIILIHAHEIMRNLDAWFVEYGNRQKYKLTDGHAHRNSPLPCYIEGAENMLYTHLMLLPITQYSNLDIRSAGRRQEMKWGRCFL